MMNTHFENPSEILAHAIQALLKAFYFKHAFDFHMIWDALILILHMVGQYANCDTTSLSNIAAM